MIQRIQTLYLLITLLLISSISYFPIAKFIDENNQIFELNFLNFEQIVADNSVIITSVFLITFFVGLISILTLVSIFLFKNRILQYRFTNFIIILLIFLLAIFTFYFYKFSINLSSLKISYVLPIIAIITTFLAGVGIKKDINIIRSVDRIR